MPRFITNKKPNDVAEFTGSLSGDVFGPQNNTQIGPGIVTNANINSSAAISDTKLATITSSGKVANSATTATPTNTNNSIVSQSGTGEVIVSKVLGDIDTAGTTLNIGTISANTINLGTANTTQIVNVGTGSGTTTINLGGAGDTINVAGTLTYINTTNLNVTDSNIILNKGGANGSSAGSGLSVEEGGSSPGYFQIDGTRTKWDLKAPASAGVASIVPGSTGIMLNQSSHDPVTMSLPGNGFYINPATQIVTMGTSSSSPTGSLTNADWTTFNNAASSVTAGLSGDITGPLNNTQIAANAIVNADINASAAIADTKLATISTAGKVSNSATTATSINSNNTIVLHNNTSGTYLGPVGVSSLGINTNASQQNALQLLSNNSANYISMGIGRTATEFEVGLCSQASNFLTGSAIGDVVLTNYNTGGTKIHLATNGGTTIYNGLNCPGTLTVSGQTTFRDNIYLQRYPGGGDYRVLSMDGGNSIGYLYANFSQLGDGIHLGYNFYYPTGSTTPTIPSPGGATSRLALTYGSISLCTGGNNIAPIEYLRVNNGIVLTQNSAHFSGPLTGNVTGSCTQIKTSNGAVSTNSNTSPTAAGMALTSTSTTDAKWDYPASLTCFRNPGYFSTSSSTMAWVDNIATALPSAGVYLVTFWCPNFTNTNSSAYNMFELRQAGVGATIAYSIPANSPTKLWEIKTDFNFSTTGALSLYGSTSVGTATFDQFYFTLTKINKFS